jgi:hypothetical protein
MSQVEVGQKWRGPRGGTRVIHDLSVGTGGVLQVHWVNQYGRSGGVAPLEKWNIWAKNARRVDAEEDTTMNADDVRKLIEEATPGPWEPQWADTGWRIFFRGHDNPMINTRDCRLGEADARLMAAAPDIARWALAQHDRAEKAEATHRDELLITADWMQRAEKAEAERDRLARILAEAAATYIANEHVLSQADAAKEKS